MLAYFLRRVALTIPTFLALMFLTFVAIRLVPGDPVEVRVGEHGMSPERLAYFRHQLGLDQPVWQQFLDYVWKLAARRLRRVAGDAAEGADRVPDAVSRDARAVVLRHAVCGRVGVPAGAIAAVKRGSLFDQALMTVSLFGYSMPIFWWGLLLIMFVSVQAGLAAGVGPHRPHQLFTSTSRPAS